jgi:hypothetical protein
MAGGRRGRAEDDAGREGERIRPTVRQPGTKPVPPRWIGRSLQPVEPRRPTLPNDSIKGEVPLRGSFNTPRDLRRGAAQ